MYHLVVYDDGDKQNEEARILNPNPIPNPNPDSNPDPDPNSTAYYITKALGDPALRWELLELEPRPPPQARGIGLWGKGKGRVVV